MPLLSLMRAMTVSKVTTLFIKNRVIQMMVAYPLCCVCVGKNTVDLDDKLSLI